MINPATQQEDPAYIDPNTLTGFNMPVPGGGNTTPDVSIDMPGLINEKPTDTTPPSTTTPPVTPPVASTYTPTLLGDPTQRVIDPATETVAGQIKGLINENNPILEMQRTQALQGMAGRGTTNSSMAQGASDAAWYQAATPIAAADANTYGGAADLNVDTANKFAMGNADIANAAAQFNAKSVNDMTINEQNNANALVMNTLDNENRLALAEMQNQYQLTAGANKTASDLFTSTMQQINNIQQSTTMNAETKQKNINDAIALLNAGLAMAGGIADIDLTSDLDFSELDTSVPGAAQDHAAEILPAQQAWDQTHAQLMQFIKDNPNAVDYPSWLAANPRPT